MTEEVKKFSILGACRKYYCGRDAAVCTVGVILMLEAFATINLVNIEITNKYMPILGLTFPLAFFGGLTLLMYNAWPPEWKQPRVIGVVWNIVLFFVVGMFHFFMILISDLGSIQIVIYCINIYVFLYLITWQWVTTLLTITAAFVTYLYMRFIIPDPNDFKWGAFIIYSSVVANAVLVFFIRPKEKQQEVVKEEQPPRSIGVLDKKIETEQTGVVRSYLLRNQHICKIRLEARKAIEEIYSIKGEQAPFDPDFIVKEGAKFTTVEDVVRDRKKFQSFVKNLYEFYNIKDVTFEDREKFFDTKHISISTLTYRSLLNCQRMYDPKEQIKLDLKIQEHGFVMCDEYHALRALENVVANAMVYGNKTTLFVQLIREEKGYIIVGIRDQGPGIPREDMHDIFNFGGLSYKPKYMHEFKGVGLALAKKIVDLHNGKIWVESDGKTGSTFKLVFPMRP